MMLLERWRPDPWIEDGHYRKRFRSRAILLTDVADAKAELEKGCDRVAIVRWPPRHDAAGGDQVQDLDSLSDFDLEGIGLYGFIEESGEPVVVMRLGSRSPAYIETNPNLDEGTTAAKAKKIQNASVRAANRIARSGRPILSPRQWQGVAKGALWLLLAILYVWYLIAARPSLPALLIAALAVTSAGFLGGQRLARSLNRRFADLQGERVVVNYLTRDQWRERRWNAKRDVIAVGTSVALTALVTVVATYWANGWRPPLP